MRASRGARENVSPGVRLRRSRTRNFGSEAFENTVDEPEPITDLDPISEEVHRSRRVFVEREKGVLTLSDALILEDNDDHTLKPAKLRVRMAVNIRSEETGGLLRHTKERRYTKDTTKKPKVIRRDEVVARSIAGVARPGRRRSRSMR